MWYDKFKLIFKELIETGYAFTKDMNDELVEKFNTGIFTQGNAILKIKYFIPKNLIVQQLPVKGREKETEINRMRDGYFTHTLISIESQEIVENRGKVIKIFEGVSYRENFIVSPFKKVIDNLFALRQKYKDENIEVMQLFKKIINE